MGAPNTDILVAAMIFGGGGGARLCDRESNARSVRGLTKTAADAMRCMQAASRCGSRCGLIVGYPAFAKFAKLAASSSLRNGFVNRDKSGVMPSLLA
jgi:hypothetical protein